MDRSAECESDDVVSQAKQLFVIGVVIALVEIGICLLFFPVGTATIGNVNETQLNRNWFGMGMWESFFLAYPLLVAIYFAKWRLRKIENDRLVWSWYWLSFVLSLPYIWFLVTGTWHTPFFSRISGWIGEPVRVWFLPTCSLMRDRNRKGDLPLFWYVARSLVEVVVLYPAWCVVWSTFQRGIGWIDF